ncbi:MAG: FKBP-type peptidyl-prolyl cis-trans isomerase [Magnetococcales bacterium]|nr:FKBP-type peptidyl-prolyl cis-trans isomerase [Magnetococcales bacterium]
MKRFTVFLAAILFLAIPQAQAGSFKTDKQKFGYFVGMQMGLELKELGIDVDLDSFVAAVKDAVGEKKFKMTPDEAQATKQLLQQEVRASHAKRKSAMGEQNLKEGAAFLAKNKSAKGVTTTASGLQYQVLAKGKGPKPTATDNVTVHYRGTLLDGTEFDSSHKRNKPISFRLDQVIPGWSEGVQLMNTGAKYRFFIPSELGYGARGAGGVIGPNATLIFDVELIEIGK